MEQFLLIELHFLMGLNFRPKEIFQWAECAQKVSSWHTGGGGGAGRGGLGSKAVGVPGPEEGEGVWGKG